MPELTLCNAAGRDAQVALESVRIPVRIRRLDRAGRQVASARILKGTLARGYGALFNQYAGDGHGDPLADMLIAADPEIDKEAVGMFLRDTKRVYVDAAGQVAKAVVHQEIVKNPDGTGKLRRPHVLLGSNIHAKLNWSGKLIDRAKAVHSYVFSGVRQILHVNGLTFDFLHAIAKELEEKDSLLLVGAGPKANQPLVLRRGALPYRGFLEGRTNSDSYLLLLHLSNLELKSPKKSEAA
jgi:hypothetical protein